MNFILYLANIHRCTYTHVHIHIYTEIDFMRQFSPSQGVTHSNIFHVILFHFILFSFLSISFKNAYFDQLKYFHHFCGLQFMVWKPLFPNLYWNLLSYCRAFHLFPEFVFLLSLPDIPLSLYLFLLVITEYTVPHGSCI